MKKIKDTSRICFLGFLMLLGISLFSCSNFFGNKGNSYSSKTGWSYNDKKYSKFSVAEDYTLPPTGPDLVLIEGGTFLMGSMEQDVFYAWDNTPRRVSLNSYYMDEAEVANVDYQEYLNWIQNVYADYPAVFQNSMPDTLAWLSPFNYNEPFAHSYFRHPAFKNYPVVGVSWYQAVDYSKWRTDRVNEHILIKGGYIKFNEQQTNETAFNTEAYLSGLQEVELGENAPSNLKSEDKKAQRKVTLNDGIILPDYRLPTEAEWEYAAVAIKVKKDDAGLTSINKKAYPWAGDQVRASEDDNQGRILANFKKGKGDYMGVAGALNDSYSETAPVRSEDFPPNDFGLYHMGGNVSEWTFDVYRLLTSFDTDDVNPFRGNFFRVPDTNEDGSLKDLDSLGRVRKRELGPEDFVGRSNILRADYRDYRDGDLQTSVDWQSLENTSQEEVNKSVYDYGNTTLINNESRVVKGGSWKDPAFYLQPGVRRFYNANLSTNWIGFRCAMTRIGPPLGEGKPLEMGSPKGSGKGGIFGLFGK